MRMLRMLTLISVTVMVAVSCTRHDSPSNTARAGDEKTLNLYNWSDYIAPDTVSSFEKQTGIKVRVSYYDSNETLRTRMLTGNSGFDVTVPSATFFQSEVGSGAYQKLDRALLPNIVNLDAAMMDRVSLNDPDNAHAVVYVWGTIGIGYNEKLVAKALPSVPLNSWRLLFEPEYAAKLAACGINMIDEPTGIVELVLQYLGKDPHKPTLESLGEVERVLTKIRPFVRNIDTAGEIEAMANGDVCVALAYNGDMVQAGNRAKTTKDGNVIKYFLPDEGAAVWFTLLAIPRDAPHTANAHAFINYIMNPRTIANITNAVGYANAIPASSQYVLPSIAVDPVVYPTPEQMKRSFVVTENSSDITRAITRVWQKFKLGQ
jgi:putrescine transport system substrate-binding protein